MTGLEGRTLDRYELQRLIGRGGMADVYLGYDPKFERTVAVKVFKREDEDMLRRFIREARLMASLNHPHLMPIYDTGASMLDGVERYYIVMPYMDAGTLRARIRRFPLSPMEACYYLSAIANALDYIHTRGIIHRDIKSSNVLLSKDGHCYLSDFGIARTVTDATQLTSTGNVLGTVDYVAPELFEVNHKADALSDLYSLGVLLFEMLTGQLPFHAEHQIALVSMHVNKPPPSPRSLAPNISPQVERVILRALAKRPEQRYRSAGQLAEAFCRAAQGEETLEEDIAEPLAAQGQMVLPYAEAETNAPAYAAPAPVVPSSSQFTSHSTQPYVPDIGAQPAPAYSPGRARRHTSPERVQVRILTVIAICALLAVTVPVALVFLAYQHNKGGGSVATPPGQAQTATIGNATATSTPPTPTPNFTATAQVVAATATQVAKNTTATAIAGTTATAEAKASATAGVIQTATANNPDYTDALNDPNNLSTQAAKWDQNDNCTFESDGYHVTQGVNLANFHGCAESGKTYQNATITVDMVTVSGHSGGLFFHVNTNVLGDYSGYLFEVDTQGNYKITRSKNFSNSNDAIVLQNWTLSPALKQGTNVKNTLQVIVRDGTLLFYANGVFLTSVQDFTYTSGKIAFLATSSGTSADIRYSNLKVYV